MKTSLALALALIGCAGLSSAASAQHARHRGHGTIEDAIRALETRWNADWARHDAARIAAYYTDDAVLMAGGERASGIAAIRRSVRQMTSDPAVSLRFHADRVVVAASGELAYSQGTYTLHLTNPQTHQPIDDHGSYVTTYRRQADGSWKAIDDIAMSQASPG